jgi:hypothetical protein
MLAAIAAGKRQEPVDSAEPDTTHEVLETVVETASYYVFELDILKVKKIER